MRRLLICLVGREFCVRTWLFISWLGYILGNLASAGKDFQRGTCYKTQRADDSETMQGDYIVLVAHDSDFSEGVSRIRFPGGAV